MIAAQGGVVRLNAEVDEIVLEAGRATGVRLVGGEVLRADVVVSNADAGHTYDRLLRNAAKRRWTQGKLARKRWSMGLFVWYFGTKGTRLKWPDVGHHTIVVGPRYREHIRDIFIRGKLAEDMSLYVHRPSVTDASVAPVGDDTFYALSPVPHLGIGDTAWASEAEPYRVKMQAMLEERLLPGLGKCLSEQLVFTPLSFEARPRSSCGLSAGCRFEADQGDWSYHTSSLQERPE